MNKIFNIISKFINFFKPDENVGKKSKDRKNEKEYDLQKSKADTIQHEIVIGFDLGTSSSKIVIRDAQLKKAYAIDFGNLGYKKNTFLLPTKLHIRDNSFTLLKQGKLINSIKTNLIDYHDKIVLEEITYTDSAIAYFALVFKNVREWFNNNLGKIYADKDIIWEINVGIPARDFNDEDLVERFEYVSLLGWELSFKKCITSNNVKLIRDRIPTFPKQKSDLISIHPEYVNAFPEVIAGVIGYAKSRMRQNRMHLLVDIGASTVDVSMFNLFRNKYKETKYAILWADIDHLGAYNYFNESFSKLPSKIQNEIKENFDIKDCIKPWYLVLENYSDKLNDFNSKYQKRIRKLIGNVVYKVKKEKNPNSPYWKKGVPFFITGGGREIEIYKTAIYNKFNDLSCMNISEPQIIEMPMPKELYPKNQSTSNIYRLNTAYGLSYRDLDIGEIRAARNIDNISKIEYNTDYSRKYISKEMT